MTVMAMGKLGYEDNNEFNPDRSRPRLSPILKRYIDKMLETIIIRVDHKRGNIFLEFRQLVLPLR
jgi:hypothetical protein